MAKKSKLQQKQEEIRHLDNATQAIILQIDKNDRRVRTWAFITLFILMTIGVGGIYKQNQIASANKNHIDCIIKDLSTPLPTGAKARVIDYQTRLSADCRIKFN